MHKLHVMALKNKGGQKKKERKKNPPPDQTDCILFPEFEVQVVIDLNATQGGVSRCCGI